MNEGEIFLGVILIVIAFTAAVLLAGHIFG